MQESSIQENTNNSLQDHSLQDHSLQDHSLQYHSLQDHSLQECTCEEINLEDSLLENIYELLFDKKLYIYGSTVIDYFLTSPRKHTHTIDAFANKDTDVCVIARKLSNALSFSFNIHLSLIRYEKCDESESDEDNDDNDEIIRIVKMTLLYKYADGISYHINLHRGPKYNIELLFDFDSICMKNENHLTLNQVINNYTIADAIKAVNDKKFRLTKGRQVVPEPRKVLGTYESTNRLLKYMEISSKTANLLNKGWKLSNQKLEKLFIPCLIAVTTKNSKCSICDSKFRKYELKLTCCKQMMCFDCALSYVISRADNTEIFCPFCKGDPFGHNTN